MPGRTAANNQQFIKADHWIERTGAPLQDPFEPSGKYDSGYQRFYH